MKNIIILVMCLIMTIGLTQNTMSQNYWPTSDTIDVFSGVNGCTFNMCYHGHGVWFKSGPVDNAGWYDWAFPSGSHSTYIVYYDPAIEGDFWNYIDHYSGHGNISFYINFILPVTSSQDINLCTGDTFSIGSHNYTTAGTYVDTLQAINTCDSIVTTNITLINYPVLTVTNDTAICAGSSVILTAGGTGNGYLWSTGESTQSITVSTADTFFVWSGNYCRTNIDSVIVTVNPLPTVHFAQDTIILTLQQNNITLTPTITNANSYLWNNGATTPTINVDTLALGWTYLTVTNNCGSAIDSILIRLSTGIFDPRPATQEFVKVCPNPATDFIEISGYNLEIESIEIYNQIGQLVLRNIDKNSLININISMLPKGIYYLKLDTHNGTAKPIRFLKE